MDYDMRGEGNPVLMPAGWNTVLITSVEISESKSGNEMYIVSTEDPITGSCDKTYCITAKGKRWLFKSLLDAMGVSKTDGIYTNVVPEEFAGEDVDVKNVPEDNEYITRTGETVKEKRNKFVSFRKATNKATL